MKSLAYNGDFELGSLYGWRTHPITGVRTFHDGVDIPMPENTPLFARESGTVRVATTDKYGGKYVQVKMDDGRGYFYLHLNRIDVVVGQRVSKGQQLGLSGSTGQSTGAHTHFTLQANAEVWNSSVDPIAFFSLSIAAARFKKGDVLVFTDIQNIRKGSSTTITTNETNKIIRQSIPGEIFTVVDLPRQADGYNWYDTGNGWAADVNKFEMYIAPIPTPTPEPIPEPPVEPETLETPTEPNEPSEPQPEPEQPTEPSTGGDSNPTNDNNGETQEDTNSPSQSKGIWIKIYNLIKRIISYVKSFRTDKK